MANIKKISYKDSLKQGTDKINSNFDEVIEEIGTVDGRVDTVDERVDTIITGGGPDKDAELVDIRTPDPSYTPQRTINVAGDVTRDMQAQFVAHKADTVTQMVNVVTGFGADPTGTKDSTQAIQDAIDYATSRGWATYLPAGKYIITDTLVLPHGAKLLGQGVDTWQANWRVRAAINADNAKEDVGTHIIAKGTLPKKWAVYSVTDMENGGGVIPNPTSRFTLDQEYRLTNFRVPGTTSTNAEAQVRMFSAAIALPDGVSSVTIENLRIRNYWDGIDGFNSDGTDGMGNVVMGDETDVGIFIEGGHDNKFDNVQVVGTYRIAGIAHIVNIGQVNENILSVSHQNVFNRVVAQGKVGYLLRGCDSYRVTAINGDQVTIKWSDSNPWNPNGGTFSQSERNYTYTHTVKDGDDLILMGVSPTPSFNVGANLTLHRFKAFGSYETRWFDSEIYSMCHPSNLSLSDPRMPVPDYPSAALEISGERIDTVRFINCQIAGRDEICMFIHDVNRVDFIGCLISSASGTAANPGENGQYRGMRIIATSEATSTAIAPSGQTEVITFSQCRIPSSANMDFRPTYGTSNPVFNGPGDNGFFSPVAHRVYDFNFPTSGTNLELVPPNDGSVVINKLNVGSRTDLVISDGAITITRGYHRVDTEGSAPTDDLDTIHGGQPGDILILMQQASGRNVTIKNGTGNIYTFDGQDIEMVNARSAVMLLKRTATEWIVLR